MLLETLDIKSNDLLIYSTNKFDFHENFKVILKKNKIKYPKPISYFDVCEIVKDPFPKNLIIYRLLTNVNSLDAFSTKYGFFININGNMEMIYFDPIFAIKDLRHLRFNLDPERFRFKIQQVGLTTLTKKEAEASFAEVYSFDLRAVEAQNQNDKIFADAIFAMDENYFDEKPSDEEMQKAEVSKNLMAGLELESDTLTSLKNISEDKAESKGDLSKVNLKEPDKSVGVRDEKISLLKNALGIKKSKEEGSEASSEAPEFSKFINRHKSETDENLDEESIPKVDLIDLFKSTLKTSEVSDRSVILKLEDKDKSK